MQMHAATGGASRQMLSTYEDISRRKGELGHSQQFTGQKYTSARRFLKATHEL
jgi:hypothetical protein